jgi:hypothetical protein
MKPGFAAAMKSFISLSLIAYSFVASAQALQTRSVARQWDEAILSAVRADYARPTVTARNLYHFSVAMYDAWAIYDAKASPMIADFKASGQPADLQAAREATISYAAFRLLNERYAKTPSPDTLKIFTDLMTSLKLDPNYASTDRGTPADYGNKIAAEIIAAGLDDGSNESGNFLAPAGEYLPVNSPLIVAKAGVGGVKNINLWQPLALAESVDQNGNKLLSGLQVSLTPFWGTLPPFGLLPSDKSPNKKGVWLDPGLPPAYKGEGDAIYRRAMEEVVELSGWMDPSSSTKVDISPKTIGNNALGSNDGKGYLKNPVTGQPYAPEVVKRGDYARVLAEFWADGPNSETPPGHWNVIANYVTDQPTFAPNWRGTNRLDRLEWDVKMYLTLNGALYDASITAWGLKGYYNCGRPISAIRYMAGLGQSSDPKLPSYNEGGIHLKPGVIELITAQTTAPGQRHAHLKGNEGKIGLHAWRGHPGDPSKSVAGVDWILGDNWVPYQKATFVTPPFPGYISGHSTFSRAGAEVLAAITGSPYFPGGMGEFAAEQNKFLKFELGPTQTIKLQWASYFDAADQSARSRVFGGIHGSIDDFPGRKLGSKIGQKAVQRAEQLFN